MLSGNDKHFNIKPWLYIYSEKWKFNLGEEMAEF